MKKFIFRFERILKIREYEEMKAKQSYAVVLQKKLQLEKENNAIENSLLYSNKELLTKQQGGQSFNASALQLYENYAKGSRVKLVENKNRIREIEHELVPLGEDLLEATKNKKTMEKLKEHDKKIYDEEIRKFVTKTNNDISNLIYVKKRRK